VTEKLCLKGLLSAAQLVSSLFWGDKPFGFDTASLVSIRSLWSLLNPSLGFDGFDTVLHFVPNLLNPAPLRYSTQVATQPKPQTPLPIRGEQVDD